MRLRRTVIVTLILLSPLALLLWGRGNSPTLRKNPPAVRHWYTEGLATGMFEVPQSTLKSINSWAPVYTKWIHKWTGEIYYLCFEEKGQAEVALDSAPFSIRQWRPDPNLVRQGNKEFAVAQEQKCACVPSGEEPSEDSLVVDRTWYPQR